MSVPTIVKGPDGGVASVIDNALVTTQLPVPASTDKILSLPYSRFFTINNDGLTNDLRSVGTLTNPVIASIGAESNADIYIKQIKIVIAASVGGNGMELNAFGGIPGGVTNGFIPYFSDKGERLPINDRPLFSNLDFIRIGSGTSSIGADDTAFRVRGAKSSTDYAYLPEWDMQNTSPGSNGLRLIAGSKQEFGVEIRDDITSLTTFEILAIGFRRFLI